LFDDMLRRFGTEYDCSERRADERNDYDNNTALAENATRWNLFIYQIKSNLLGWKIFSGLTKLCTTWVLT